MNELPQSDDYSAEKVHAKIHNTETYCKPHQNMAFWEHLATHKVR